MFVSFGDRIKKIEEEHDFSKNNLNAIKDCLIELLQGKANCLNDSLSVDIEIINQGSTSVCYVTSDNDRGKVIYKEFHPHGIKCKEIVVAGNYGFWWIDDYATEEQIKSFLKRYIRFIRQSAELKKLMTAANEEKSNIFITPELVLTSKGFMYCDHNYFGSTLEEEFKNSVCTTINGIINRIQLVKKAAENINYFYHKHNIFHGDIKPENFLKIDIGSDGLVVRNIDFDTCVSQDEIETGYLDSFVATTELFYNRKEFNQNNNLEDWLILDVKALAKLLMYGLCGNQVNEKINSWIIQCNADKCNFEWFKQFFGKDDTAPARTIFNVLQADKKLSALFIFNKLKLFLLRCSDQVKPRYLIKTLDEFLEGLSEIENLFIAANGGSQSLDFSKVETIKDFLRYSGICRLDNTSGDESIKNSYEDAIRYRDTINEILSGYFTA